MHRLIRSAAHGHAQTAVATFLQLAFRRSAVLLSALVCLALVAGCTTANPAYDAGLRHHRPDGFQNNYTEFTGKGLGELIRWRWQAWRGDLPPPPAAPVPTVAPDLAFLNGNTLEGRTRHPAVTWIGHASTLVQAGGLNVLTDPMFSQRASPVDFIGPQRAQPPGLRPGQLPHIDLVLISHNHYDHLDLASVRALAAQPGGAPLFIVPLGLKVWLADQGIPGAIELDWWQTHELSGTLVMLTPVQHWSGRGLFDRLATLWGGYVVLSPDLHWFFGGDTGYSKDFADIRQRLAPRQGGTGFDLAVLPVGAYEPRWFMAEQHVSPAEAVQIHRDLGAQRALGMHWGTFELTDEPRDQPPRDLAKAARAAGLAEGEFRVLAVGETWRLPPRAPQITGAPAAPANPPPKPAR